MIDPESRKKISNEFIKKQGIDVNEYLPNVESSSFVKLKSIDEICNRAIACLLSTQIAGDIMQENNYEESRLFLTGLLKKFSVENKLLSIEKRLFYNKYEKKDALYVLWTYECYWSLAWALGLISDDEMLTPYNLCDCSKAVNLVINCKNFEEFKDKTKIRDIEEILDMLDLYYRYHWVCVEKSRINPNTNIGKINPEVVWERRKALEWLISEETDWNDIPLNT
jgi:hypothetical protein